MKKGFDLKAFVMMFVFLIMFRQMGTDWIMATLLAVIATFIGLTVWGLIRSA